MRSSEKISLSFLQQQVTAIGLQLYKLTIESNYYPKLTKSDIYKAYETLIRFENGEEPMFFKDLVTSLGLVIKLDISSIAVSTPISVANGTLFSALVLPSKVLITYSDSSKGLLKVTWAAGSYNAAVAAVYTLQGTVTLPTHITNTGNKKGSIAVTVGA